MFDGNVKLDAENESAFLSDLPLSFKEDEDEDIH